MRPQKVADEDIMTGLSKAFRAKGYEGTSLSELAQVTGLKKASLYHRFPKGKQEMAESVLEYIDLWVKENIFSSLTDASNSPAARLKNGLFNINILYDGGKETCILRAFSMQMGLDLFQQTIPNAMNDWIIAFTAIGVALGLPHLQAREKAIQTLIDIQGSLILSEGLSETDIFKNTLRNIEKRYLSP